MYVCTLLVPPPPLPDVEGGAEEGVLRVTTKRGLFFLWGLLFRIKGVFFRPPSYKWRLRTTAEHKMFGSYMPSTTAGRKWQEGLCKGTVSLQNGLMSRKFQYHTCYQNASVFKYIFYTSLFPRYISLYFKTTGTSMKTFTDSSDCRKLGFDWFNRI